MTPKIYSFLLLLYVYSSVSVNTRYYPKYHLAPPKGWMNDPNGFCIFKGVYHLFYQCNPLSSQEPGIANWAHAKSKDLFHWENLPIAMAPDDKYDSSGVFSGSAHVENDKMYLFYTGNVNHPGATPDHEQHQALAYSIDGVNVTKYEQNPIIEGSDRQPNFRDPKVWKHDDTYYMVLGNSYANNTLGRALLYSSKDMYNWTEASILDSSYGSLGYMWECPDMFELNGLMVLLFSPQGMTSQGIDYNNLYQTGYIVGSWNYETHKFTQIFPFRELDSGHDFYATQTIEDKNGNRVMIAWLDMWEEVYPERDDGFTGQMTLPRVLTLDRHGRLLQKPVTQIQNAVGKELHSGPIKNDTVVKLEDNIGKINISAPGTRDCILLIESNQKPAVTISYDYEHGLLSLDRGGKDGKRSRRYRPEKDLCLTIYVDSSSVELFTGDGLVTFSSRYFPSEGNVAVRIADSCEAYQMTVHRMKHTTYAPDDH